MKKSIVRARVYDNMNLALETPIAIVIARRNALRRHLNDCKGELMGCHIDLIPETKYRLNSRDNR